MARLDTYRTFVQELLKTYSKHKLAGKEPQEMETQLIFDTERDHYQLVRAGWFDDEERVYGCVVHMDIKDGKIWIQHDGTDVSFADKLVEMGVPKEDIVLAFHPPYKRPYTTFGVN